MGSSAPPRGRTRVIGRGRQAQAERDPLPPERVTAEPLGWPGCVARYRAYRAMRGMRPATLRTEACNLVLFMTWVEERGVKHPSQVTRPIIEAYQRHVHRRVSSRGRPLAPTTQMGLLTVLRTFFRWAVRSGEVQANPAADLELPRLAKRVPEALTPSEAAAVLAQPDLSIPEGVRDRAIMEVLYSTGLRRTELCGLLRQDVDAERGTVYVRIGKGGKNRWVPIGARALWWVQRYQVEVDPQWRRDSGDPQRESLFINAHGLPVTISSLSGRVRDYLTSAGITRFGSCHLFRHGMATGLLEHGCDLRLIQAMLGHASPETTARYTQVTMSKLVAAHRAFHPAEQGGIDSAGGNAAPP